jgi:NAD(P)-dependent dehydrogenase (short-subunit alcohol dehydrogenase family)
VKRIVISGGTDGIGKALALTYLSRGDSVVVLGRNAHKGTAFLKTARNLGAAARASFIRTDLSLVAENRRAIGEITAAHPVVDALVLCARHFRSTRLETAEGLENTFALEYLSRFLLSHGLSESLEQAGKPVIVNVSGPGVPKPEIRWHDPGLERGYDGVTAQLQAGRANDLLGVAFAAEHGTGPIRYVLLNPGGVATSFSGEYDAATAAYVEALKKSGKPVEAGIAPITARIDWPPAEPLSAFMESRRISTGSGDFDPAAATRLATLTRDLLPR